MDIKTFLLIVLGGLISLVFHLCISGTKVIIMSKIPDFNGNSLVCISHLIRRSWGKELRVELGDISVEDGISENLCTVLLVCQPITSELRSFKQTGIQAIYAKPSPSSQQAFFSTVFRDCFQIKSS